jgi:transcriptional regulator with XRE-family HTH domain
MRAKARDLRKQGLNYEQIAAELGVSKSSVSLWVRDLPRPAGLSPEACRERSAARVSEYWAAERPAREAALMVVRNAAMAEIGQLTERELLIAGAVTYWCEGGKNKPHRRDDRVSFINSDPGLVRFFLRFLEVAGVERELLIFRVYVHENADVASAQHFWLDVTRARPAQFRPPTLKRNNPATVRKNTGSDYHGCLRIDVRRSASLYIKIEGWAAAAMARSGAPREVVA